jgi:uncharacterized protein YndB with AHSA1/START domain
VWDLLTRPEGLTRWWPEAAEVEPRLGGRVRLVFNEGADVVHGEVTRWEPPHALSFTWAPPMRPDVTTEIAFTVEPVDDARVRVEVVHTGWEAAPELRPGHERGWDLFLPRLADVAGTTEEGGKRWEPQSS